MKRVEILAIGREILSGRVLDTNTHWLARRLTGLGGKVQRRVIVDDEPEEIARAVSSSLERGAEVVVTTGGLGPTYDDLTLEGVSRAAGRPLRLNAQALKFVAERYQFLYEKKVVASVEMNSAREKMARIPEGAQILDNPVGTAPGVMVELENALIVCLPGVPEEIEEIFKQSLERRLKDHLGGGIFLEETTQVETNDESVLTEAMVQVLKTVPGVYLKSNPSHFVPNLQLKVRVTASGDEEEEVKKRIQRAIEELKARLRRPLEEGAG